MEYSKGLRTMTRVTDSGRTFGRLFAPVEFKFFPEAKAEPGTFAGYANVFNKLDRQGDITKPGAFAQSLADHKAAGTMPGLYAQHSFAMWGGDPLPVGIWERLEEDEKGLYGVGRISALDSDHGKRMVGLMRDGALPGLSIAYDVPDGGVTLGKKPGEPKRWLHQLNLYSVDIVSNPANPDAQISSVKSVLAQGDHAAALAAVTNALALHRQTMAGGDAPTTDERTQLLGHLQTAYRALAGDDPKSAPETIREFEAALQGELHYSHRIAREIAAHGWKAAHQPRDEAAAVAEVTDALRGSAEALRRLTFAA
jgi:HK97 family phage prohead protease